MAITRSNHKEAYEYLGDKYETKKRIERKKKAIKKKVIDEDYGRHKHPMHYKKTVKTNWTKQYEYGLLDEDNI